MVQQFNTSDVDVLRKEMYALVNPLNESVKLLNGNVSSLQTAADTTTETFAEISNILNNSHPEWSDDAYSSLGISPADAGDGNLEAYNWYRALHSDVALPTTTAEALKAEKTIEPADHSLWAANEGVDDDIPRWDKTNARIEVGGLADRYDLYVPVPNDIIFPGNTFYVQFEAMLRTSTPMPSGLQVYCGIWDRTPGQEKWIEGGSFTITGEIFGDQSGSTSVNYQVLARTDSGEEAISNILSFTNAPAVFSGNNHPRVNFSGVAGFIEFEIYREIAGAFVLQYVVRNAIEGTYYDVGNPPIRVVAGFPSVTTTKPRAFAQTTTFQPGSLNSLTFIRQDLTIFIPTTYDRSVTDAGNQFFRIGLTTTTAEARQLVLRRFGFSQGYGLWSRSANDVRPGAHSSPSTTAAGSPGGSGGIDPDPPDPGTGRCVLLSSIIRLADGEMQLGDLPKHELLDSGGAVCGRNLFVKRGYASRIYNVVTESGCRVCCTWDHPLITGPEDYFGTAAQHLKKKFDEGQEVYVLTKPARFAAIERSLVVRMDAEYGDFAIGSPIMEGTHIYIAGGILGHNLKPLESF